MIYKPDLNEKITIRLSVATKSKLRDLCRRSELDEATISRLVLEAGMQIANEQGVAAMIEKRQQILSPAGPQKTAKTGKTVFTVTKGDGTKWNVMDPAGKIVGTGPLYVVRPLAKKVCPEGGEVILIREDGSKERLA